MRHQTDTIGDAFLGILSVLTELLIGLIQFSYILLCFVGAPFFILVLLTIPISHYNSFRKQKKKLFVKGFFLSAQSIVALTTAIISANYYLNSHFSFGRYDGAPLGVQIALWFCIGGSIFLAVLVSIEEKLEQIKFPFFTFLKRKEKQPSSDTNPDNTSESSSSTNTDHQQQSEESQPEPEPPPIEEEYIDVTSDFLMMRLHQKTGHLEGWVMAGRFVRQELKDLNIMDLYELWQECFDDCGSRALLEDYLDRTHPGNKALFEELKLSRNSKTEPNNQHNYVPMTEDIALLIMRLQPGFTKEELKKEQRRLRQQTHPDYPERGSHERWHIVEEAYELLLRKIS